MPLSSLAAIAALILCLVMAPPALARGTCVLKMVYKEGDKLPLIAQKPDNSGLYRDLFTEAARRIGCELEITRLPKARLHMELEKGTYDFYPGASFSERRATYLYYMENGLPTGEYFLTSAGTPDLSSYRDLRKVRDLGLIWLMEFDSSKAEKPVIYGINAHAMPYVDVETVAAFAQRGRKVFYVADMEIVDYYLRQNGRKSLERAGLKLHRDTELMGVPMYLGFSRRSPHWTGVMNPAHSPVHEGSPTNQAVVPDPDCVAARLGRALLRMKDSGYTAKLRAQYFEPTGD